MAGMALANLCVLRVSGVVSDGELLTVTTPAGAVVLEFDTDAAYTAGRIRADISAGGTKASQTLTLTENAANTNTVTIGAIVYTLQTTLTNVAYNVKIGADASATIDNLIAAITGGAGAGTLYAAATTAHPLVTAAAGSGDTMVATARYTGTAANSYATTDTLAGSSAWGNTTLLSGAQPTAEQGIDALVLAWNAGQGQYQAVKISASEVLFIDSDYGNTPATFVETMANGAVSAAAAYRGRKATASTGPVAPAIVAMVPTAVEVLTGNLHVVFPFTPAAVLIDVRVTSTGARKAWDGGYTITAGRVTLDNSGSTDWAATDTVTIVAGPTP